MFTDAPPRKEKARQFQESDRAGSIQRTLRKGPTGQWEYGETKRSGSRRLIRLQNWIVEKLKELKKSQVEHPTVDPEEWPEAVDLIFVTELGN